MFLLLVFQKITWIGPLKFSSSVDDNCGTVQLAETVSTIDQSRCDVTFVGKMESAELLEKLVALPNVHFLKNAAVAWKALKGRKLHGLMALDRVCTQTLILEFVRVNYGACIETVYRVILFLDQLDSLCTSSFFLHNL